MSTIIDYNDVLKIKKENRALKVLATIGTYAALTALLPLAFALMIVSAITGHPLDC